MTLGELVAQTEDDLKRIKNLGETSIQEIKVELGRHGLALRGQTPLSPENPKWSLLRSRSKKPCK
jgi:DNA-directed RNA polymerase alpha subunit